MTIPPDGMGRDRDVPVVSIPDIRDYQKINAELVALLDAGHRRVRLAGAEGQRLLGSGLRGAWNALIDLEGLAGTELAAALDAPGLTIVCRGPAADGAGAASRRPPRHPGCRRPGGRLRDGGRDHRRPRRRGTVRGPEPARRTDRRLRGGRAAGRREASGGASSPTRTGSGRMPVEGGAEARWSSCAGVLRSAN